jgi:hypothetical protein
MKRRALEGLLDVDQEVRKRPDPRRDTMTNVCTVIYPPSRSGHLVWRSTDLSIRIRCVMSWGMVRVQVLGGRPSRPTPTMITGVALLSVVTTFALMRGRQSPSHATPSR